MFKFSGKNLNKQANNNKKLDAIGRDINLANIQETYDLGCPERVYFEEILKNEGKNKYAIVSWTVETLDSTQGLLSAGYKSPEWILQGF